MIRAKQFLRVLHGGSGAPGLVRLADGRECIVKWSSADRYVAAIEYLAANLCGICGFRVPTPIIVHIDENVVQQVEDPEVRQIAELNIGPNCGFAFIHQAQSLCWNDLAAQVAKLDPRLFVFDVLLLNADRSLKNPNLMLAGGKLYVHDFDAALQIHNAVLGSNYNINGAAAGLRMHPCYAPKTQALISWNDSERSALRALVESMPDEWITPAADRNSIFECIDAVFSDSAKIFQNRLGYIHNQEFKTEAELRRTARANRTAFEKLLDRL